MAKFAVLCDSVGYSLGEELVTYVVRLNRPKPTAKLRAIWVLLFGGIYFLGMFAWKFFWPSPYERREGLHSIALELVVVSLFWGIGMAFLPKRIPSYKLLVDEISITCVIEYTGWLKWLVFRKTVSNGRVRSIRELRGRLGRPGGCTVSERTGWEAWIYGGVFISKSLPEYDELRALVESWRVGA